MTTDLRDQLQATLGSAYVFESELGGGGLSRVFVAEEAALGHLQTASSRRSRVQRSSGDR